MDFDKENIHDGYSAHEGYFEEMEASVLGALNPRKNQLPDTADGYGIDEAYFDNLESVVLQRLHEEKRPRAKVIAFKDKGLWYAVAIAAACIALVITFTFKKDNTTPSFATLSPEVTQYYLDQQELFLTDSELEYLLQDDVDELTIEDSILDEDISNYLMEEDLLLLQELQEQ